MKTEDDDGFLSRWSRRKVQVQRGLPVESAPADEPALPVQPATAAALPAADAVAGTGATTVPAAAEQPAEDRPPPPTLEDARLLGRDSDFRRFVARDVDPQVRNTALKTLFSNPHFNVMDGLDTYIDDYGKPDPLPPGMLRQMVQSAALGLFRDEKPEGRAAVPADPIETEVDAPAEAAIDAPAADADALPAPETAAPGPPDPTPDEDTDLRLQPDDDAGRAGTEPGADEDARRQR